MYYTMNVIVDGKLAPEFGDFDREVVKQEIEDSIGSWSTYHDREYRKSDFKITTSNK